MGIDPYGLVRWKGVVKSFNWLAYSRDEYELQSECKCGSIVRVTVSVDSLGISLGASASTDAVEFDDGRNCPEPMVFAGPAWSWNFAVGVDTFSTSGGGGSVGIARLGPSPQSDVIVSGASVGASVGRARVNDIRSWDCCEKK